jgi:hypothetical protein
MMWSRGDGPERITANGGCAPASYPRARLFPGRGRNGGRFWLFRRGDGVDGETGDLSWWMHGAFGMTAYVELQATTHFSFLRGASSPDELFAAAAMQGHAALGIADRGSVAGMVQALAGAEGDRRPPDRGHTARSRRWPRRAALPDGPSPPGRA